MILNKLEKNKLPLKNNDGEELINESVIIEALGLFPKQNELAEYLTDICYDMFYFGIKEKKIHLEDFNHIKGVIIKLEVLPDFSFSTSTRAEFWGVTGDYLIINVVISKYDKNTLDKEQLKAKLSSLITHELNHGYVMLSKYYNSNKIDERSSYYDACLKIYNDNTINDNIRDICYILYSIYHVEIQAMVPQVYQELNGYFKNSNAPISIDKFKNALKKTNTFWTFYSGIYYDIPKIYKYLNVEHNLNMVVEVFKENGLDIHKEMLLKKIKQAKHIYEKALKDICRCAVAYYYDKTENKNG